MQKLRQPLAFIFFPFDPKHCSWSDGKEQCADLHIWNWSPVQLSSRTPENYYVLCINSMGNQTERKIVRSQPKQFGKHCWKEYGSWVLPTAKLLLPSSGFLPQMLDFDPHLQFKGKQTVKSCDFLSHWLYCSAMGATRWGICSAGKISHDFLVALKTLPAKDHQVVWVQDKPQMYRKKKVYGTADTTAAGDDLSLDHIL